MGGQMRVAELDGFGTLRLRDVLEGYGGFHDDIL